MLQRKDTGKGTAIKTGERHAKTETHIVTTRERETEKKLLTLYCANGDGRMRKRNALLESDLVTHLKLSNQRLWRTK